MISERKAGLKGRRGYSLKLECKPIPRPGHPIEARQQFRGGWRNHAATAWLSGEQHRDGIRYACGITLLAPPGYSMRGYFACLLFSLSLSVPCRASEPATDDFAFFEKKIRPLLTQQCLKCHSRQAQTSGKLRGGLLLDSAAGWQRGGDTGPAIVPGKPGDSLLIRSLSHGADLKMPPSGKLPAAMIAELTEWVRRGAPDPRVDTPATNHRQTGLTVAEGRAFWSYRPVASPPVPPVKNPTWPAGTIDHFVLASLEGKGLVPAAEADRLTLFRRLSLDLTGLPPNPVDALAFANSTDARFLEQAVDRLLASPAFAERWARHWLDVARYGESVTLRGFIFPNAWRYRDFVIDAFAADMPYDQFLRLQIAGDLIPGANPSEAARNRVATTFLVLGDNNFEEQVKKQLDMDVVDDMLEAIGSGMLGQTITCARCHDHKFDPIPTRDYYALAGILANVQAMEHANVSKWIDLPLPLDAATEATLAAHEKHLAELEKQVKALQGDRATQGVLPLKDAPGIVIDDTQARKVGDWQHSTHSGTYLGTGYLHDKNAGKGSKSLTFQPVELPAGRYAVWLAYSPGDSRSTAVPVTIFCSQGEVEKSISLRAQPTVEGRYASLGEYRFEKNVGYVTLSNQGTTGHVTADAVLFVPLDRATATPAGEQLESLRKKLKAAQANGPDRPRAMGVRERSTITDARIHIRGQVATLGAPVPRGFLQVASSPKAPTLPAGQSGRLQLADWIASVDNPLTPRVYVNRVWHWLLGAGLVRTVDNFGTTGEKPSHPELLDHLAQSFIQEGWSVKKLVRQIVLSKTYRQASGVANPLDPENRLLCHANRRRLDAECIRDALLVAGGNLAPGGHGSAGFAKAESDYGFSTHALTRSLYLPVFRNVADPCLEVFDRANPSRVVGTRDTSTVAPQALFLLNNPLVASQASLVARRVLQDTSLQDDRARFERLWLLLLGRHPTEGELAQARQHTAHAASAQESWTTLAHALFATPDFRYVD
ncbi:MAG: DUF1553 domain-containing protein [Planctomycetota bacterium]|nr:MAG: DUF1553 domain-containing protein [Planctomycetota bacterium]